MVFVKYTLTVFVQSLHVVVFVQSVSYPSGTCTKPVPCVHGFCMETVKSARYFDDVG